MNIGFSTGSIAYGDFRKAVSYLNVSEGNVIELSALREIELVPLINALDDLKLEKYEFVSFHAPSKIQLLTEKKFVYYLSKLSERGWPIIIHPDIITNFDLWKPLGKSVCLENMDKRKKIGRTTVDMKRLFDKLPDAGFCFDIAHVRQVDPTLIEGIEMISSLKDKLVQLHVSEVNSESTHCALTFESIIAFSALSPHIPKKIPIVLETPVTFEMINREIEKASWIFDNKLLLERLLPHVHTSVFFHRKVESLKNSLALTH